MMYLEAIMMRVYAIMMRVYAIMMRVYARMTFCTHTWCVYFTQELKVSLVEVESIKKDAKVYTGQIPLVLDSLQGLKFNCQTVLGEH